MNFYQRIISEYQSKVEEDIRTKKLQIGYHTENIGNPNRSEDCKEDDRKFLEWDQARLRALERIQAKLNEL